MRGKWALFGGIVILAAIGAGALSVWRKQQAPPPPPPKPAVETPTLPPGAEVSLSGKIEAREIVSIQAPSTGTIQEYLVAVGEEVFEGQLIARIDNPGLTAEQQNAKESRDKAQERVNTLESQMLASRLEASRSQAELARVRDDYSRLERVAQRQQVLHSAGATPRLTFERATKDFETARLEFESAAARAKSAEERVTLLTRDIELARKTLDEKSADLEEADSDLQATQMHAPVDGIILSRKGDAGADVALGEDKIFEIATDLGQLQVVVEPDPPTLAKLQPGLEATIILAENASEPLRAEISRIEEGKVYVLFGSPDPSIRPGLSAQVRFKLP
jgi:multidrug efflux pump subunit AcrA (membrane-fusion protein)